MTHLHESPSRLSRRPIIWAGIAVVLVLGAAGCQGQAEPAAAAGDQVTIETLQSAAAAQAALPKCAEIFAPGKEIDFPKPETGCLDPSGGVQFLGSFNCADGRQLFSVDAHTGATAGWGYGGGKFYAVQGEVAADAGYGKAYSACNG